MKALVTGATGFLGGRLTARLVRLGWSVTAVGRNETAGASLTRQGVCFVRADLSDETAVSSACRGQDAVFHCGALSSPWGRYREYYGSNVLGTRHVIAGCLRHDVGRMIHVSTPTVYFDYTHRLQIPESGPLPDRPANAYAATKRLAEREVERAAAAGLPVVTVRPRALFGPGDTTILPRLIRANAARGIPLIGGGRIEVDFTYIDNAVDALLLCAAAPTAAIGRTYNITNGEPALLVDVLQRLFDKLGVPMRGRPVSYSLVYGAAGLLELIARLVPGCPEPLLTRYTAGVLGRSQTLDITAARRELGYVPRVKLEEGLDAFAAWWNEHGGGNG
jgi:nucleoside-diphosphate-sugar epimerase